VKNLTRSCHDTPHGFLHHWHIRPGASTACGGSRISTTGEPAPPHTTPIAMTPPTAAWPVAALAMLQLLELPDGAAGNSTAAWLGQRAALTHEVLGYGPGVLPNRSVPDLVLTWPTEPSLKGLVWDMSKYFTINSTVYASSPFFSTPSCPTMQCAAPTTLCMSPFLLRPTVPTDHYVMSTYGVYPILCCGLAVFRVCSCRGLCILTPLAGGFFRLERSIYSPVSSWRRSKSTFFFHHGHSNCICPRGQDAPIIDSYKCRPGCNSSMPSEDEVSSL